MTLTGFETVVVRNSNDVCLQLSQPLPAGALDGVSVTLSDQGEACDQACAKKGKRCNADKLALLNTCDRLREKVRVCQGLRCSAGSDTGMSMLEMRATH